MIGVIITIIVICIVLLLNVYIVNKKNNIRIEELEMRLDRYYKERAERLKNKGLIK